MPTLDDFLNHPIEALERALHIKKQIDQLNEVLKELFGPTPISLAGVQTTVPERKAKRTMSAAGRARVAAAQRARWAKVKAQKSSAAPGKSPPRKKRHLSPEARARIVAAVKARWARVKKQKKSTAAKGRKLIAEAGQPKFKIF